METEVYILIKQLHGAINEIELFSERPTFQLDPLWLLYFGGIDGGDSIRIPEGEQSAYAHGVEAAKTAASWVVDGNTDRSHIKGVLKMLDDGDLEVDEYLPRRPDLSGEFADNMTPAKLAHSIYGEEWDVDLGTEGYEALIDAWEEAVDDHFTTECERLLRNAINEEVEA